jgi:opacity protein-like surface antigen
MVAVAVPQATYANRIPRNFVPLSLSYSWPGGGLTENVDAQPALGFSLGYQFAVERNLRLTVRGTWMRMNLGTVDTTDLTNYGLTHIGFLGGVLYRFIKHGWTPYVQAEGGMGIMFADELIANVPRKIDGLSEVKVSFAGTAGVMIPVSENIDVDISGRYHYTYVDAGFSAVAGHVGVVYSLR